MKVLMIIPAYNEQKSILKTVQSIQTIQKADADQYTLDYVVVNDGSTDHTKKVCLDHNLHVINLPINLGIGGAVQTGYKYALYNDYDIAIQFDGDGQHDASYIKDLVKTIRDGNDIVIGSRFVEELSTFKSTAVRRVGIHFLSGLIRLCTGKRIYDPTSGFRACNRKIITEFAKEYPIDYPEPDTIVTIIKNGYRVQEVPVKMNERQEGQSSITTSMMKPVYYMIKVSLAILVASLSGKRAGDNHD